MKKKINMRKRKLKFTIVKKKKNLEPNSSTCYRYSSNENSIFLSIYKTSHAHIFKKINSWWFKPMTVIERK